MEIQACSKSGLTDNKCAPFLGRGQFPKLVWTPILEKVDLSEDWGDSHVHWWLLVGQIEESCCAEAP
eukprot:15318277-Heterocapsa_arctica.AAC.1